MTKVKILLRKYLDLYMWEPLIDYEKAINDFVETHDVIELAPIGMDGVIIRYKDKEVIKPEAVDNVTVNFTGGLPPDHGEHKVTWPIGIPHYKRFTTQRGSDNEDQNCIKCDKPFTGDDARVPASGHCSNTYVHGACWQGCNDGGPHHWEDMTKRGYQGYQRCSVCGVTQRI